MLLILSCMYGYYTYLWSELILYSGKAGWKGFGFFLGTAVTLPFYIVFHFLCIYVGHRGNNKFVVKANLIGILLYLLHVMLFFSF